MDSKQLLEARISIDRWRYMHKLSLWELQWALFTNIMTQVRQLQLLRDALRTKRAEVDGPDRELTDAELRDFERDKVAREAIIAALRDLGDGILWRALEFDRSVLYLLTTNPRQSRTRVDVGLQTELWEIAKVASQPDIHQVIINDTTNFLRMPVL